MALRYLVWAVLLAGCGAGRPSPQTGEPLRETLLNHLYVVVSDFTTGGVVKRDLRTGKWDTTVLPAHADALARWSHFTNELLVLNRLAGNHLTVTSPQFAMRTQIGFADAANPQDILPLSIEQAYVASLHDTHLRRWNLRTGQAVGEGIDLSPWKDVDGYTEASYLHASVDRVALTLQQLDTRTYNPAGPGMLVVIDPQTDTVDAELTRPLARSNPFTEFKTWNGDLYLGEAGVMDRTKPVLDGGIEKLDGKNFRSGGIVVSELALGGDILDFEILTAELGVAIISTPQTDVVLFLPGTGQKVSLLLSGGGYRFAHVLVDRERSLFYLADRLAENPAVRVFDFTGVEKVASRLPLELPPFKILLAP